MTYCYRNLVKDLLPKLPDANPHLQNSGFKWLIETFVQGLTCGILLNFCAEKPDTKAKSSAFKRTCFCQRTDKPLIIQTLFILKNEILKIIHYFCGLIILTKWIE
jgi:hypothetical protein